VFGAAGVWSNGCLERVFGATGVWSGCLEQRVSGQGFLGQVGVSRLFGAVSLEQPVSGVSRLFGAISAEQVL
jgi:hypothetical protein